MKQLTVLIKPASSLCNMRCKYCFYSDVSKRRTVPCYGIMQPETVSSILRNLFAAVEDGGNLDIAFQGGEPTVAGLAFFRNFVKTADEIRNGRPVAIHYSLQTNGYVVDEDWCEFFAAHDFLIGLSLDGPKKFHDQNRLGADGKGTYRNVLHAAQLLREHKVDFNILCVLTKGNARHPKQLWDFFLQNDLSYLQFIPCLPELEEEENNYSLTPQLFHDFYTELFRLWAEELSRGHYVSVKLFDDMAGMFVYHQVSGCGMDGRCNLQYIVEADGSVSPCDFYVLDEYRLGNLAEEPVEQIQKNFAGSTFHQLRDELPETCQNCKYLKLCRGGCVRLRKSMYLSGDYCGYAHLLKDIGDPLIRAVQWLNR